MRSDPTPTFGTTLTSARAHFEKERVCVCPALTCEVGLGTAPGCIPPGRAACPGITRRSKKQLTDSSVRSSGTPDAAGMTQSAIRAVEPIGNEEDPGYGVPDLGGPGGTLVAGLARDRGDQHEAQVTRSPRSQSYADTGPRPCSHNDTGL